MGYTKSGAWAGLGRLGKLKVDSMQGISASLGREQLYSYECSSYNGSAGKSTAGEGRGGEAAPFQNTI